MPRRINTTAFLAICMAGIVAFSFFVLSKLSLRLDESQSLWQTSHTPLRLFSIVAQDVHVPFYHILLHYWQLFLGNSVEASRSLSLIFFVFTVPVLYKVGEDTYARKIGLFSALLIAVSPFLNWYGNEIRMYSMLAFFTALNQLYFMRLYHKGTWGAWLGYTLTALCGAYTHYFFLFVLATQVLFYWTHRRHFIPKSGVKIFLTMFLVVAALSPWLYYVYLQGFASTTQPLLQKPTTVNLFSTYTEFIFGFQDDQLNTIVVSFWPLMVLLGFLALQKSRTVSPETRYFFMSASIPVVLVFFLSIFVKPIYVSRYLIITIPGLYIFLAWLLSTYPRKIATFLRAALVIIMLVTLAVQTISSQTPVKEDYEAATTYLTEHAQPQDVIVVSPPFTVYPVEYYYQGSAAIDTLPVWNRFQAGPLPTFSEAALPGEVKEVAGEHRTIWILFSYDQGYQSQEKDYFDKHYHMLYSHQFSPGLTLYRYQLRYDSADFSSL